MGLDIWFKEDIANILRAADEANLSAMVAANGGDPAALTGEAARMRQAYRSGFSAALATVALALGLPMPAAGVSSCPRFGGQVKEMTGADGPKQISPPRR